MMITFNAYEPYRNLFKSTIQTICICFFASNLYAQDALSQIREGFTNHQQAIFREKIYVHTDKDYYNPGEIIWFKIYNTDASNNRPSNLSKITYVEVLDSAKKPLLQGKIGMDQATGRGSFFIPASTPSGNYILRAYTNWMKNFDPAFYFEKKITIINLRKLPLLLPENNEARYRIEFFPEGGNIVSGFENKVAFKAVTNDGKPYDFTGYIITGSDTLAQFVPYKDGMGSFSFTPVRGNSYNVVIRPLGGQSFIKKLPEIYNSGYVLRLNEDSNSIVVTASTNVTSASTLYLIAHNKQNIKIAQKADLQNGSATFRFNRSDLGDGVTHITLFNGLRIAVAERLYYREPEKNSGITVKTNLESYNRKSGVDINISSADLDTASLSMAVYKLDSLQKNDENDIASYFYLTSELGSYINNAAYYFLNKDRKATENLLLTHGWRRFNWEEIIENKKPSFEFAPEYSGHIITGRVLNTITNSPASNIITYISSPSLMTQFKTAASSKNGSIAAEIKNFIGGTHLIAQTNPKEDSIYKIEINNPFSKKYNNDGLNSLLRPLAFPSTLLKQSVSMQVQNIYHTDQLNRFQYPAFTDTSSFFGKPDAWYNLESYTRFTTIEEILREYVPLVAVRRRGSEVRLPMVSVDDNQYLSLDPINLLDGVPIFNFNKFFEFDPLKINKLELISQRYIYGKSVFDGILNWKTYNPSIQNYSLEPGAVILDYPGLQLERKFYSPVYDNEEQKRSRLPDFRNVLKWSPDIKLMKGENYTEKIYSSDLPGRYLIVIQGLDKSGVPGSAIKYFEVK